MSYRITVDTGGTFTDVVLADDNELLGFFKAPTTPADMFVGVREGIEQAAASCEMALSELLAATSLFVYSTTRGTNAILESTTARTAFVTTAGHRDMLVYREGGKPDPFNLRIEYPKPYVPRLLTFEVRERITSDGSVDTPLSHEDVEDVATRLGELEVEAIGVCLLWAVVNSAHEEEVGQILAERLRGVEISLSHRVNPIIREFRRASATVIDASLKPLMRAHLQDIDRRLRELGYRGEPLSVTHVSGGMLSLAEICDAPIQSIDSGPALGPVAGREIATAELKTATPDVIITDLGGTSFDISIVSGGALTYTREKWLGPEYLGHPTGMHAVDTRSVSAGGGSIARVDEDGVIRVGPESAGADPGPVCYGRGGTKPTVTDAAAVLGYLDPEYFAGGRFELNLNAAKASVMEHVATPLGMSPEGAATAVLAVATELMRSFVHDQTVRQGLDPRSCLLVSGGGAAGLNIVDVARELEVFDVLIPSGAGVLCAIGGQYADVVMEFSERHFTETRRFSIDAVNDVLARLDAQVDDFLRQIDEPGEAMREYFCEARYVDQNWEIDVSLPASRFEIPQDVAAFEEEFHRTHRRLFAVDQPGQSIECINWRIRGRHVRSKPGLPRATAMDARAVPAKVRPVWMDSRWQEIGIYDGLRLGAGSTLVGPALIEDPTTTIVVPTGSRVRVTEFHNYRIEISAAADKEGVVA